MNSNVKLFLLLIIALPICFGASVLLLPDKLIQALPGKGDGLVSIKEKLRHNVISWFEDAVQSVEPSIGITADDGSIILGRSAEVQIPTHVLLELGRKMKIPVAVLPAQPPNVTLNTELELSAEQMVFKINFAESRNYKAILSLQNETPLTLSSGQKRRLIAPLLKVSSVEPFKNIMVDRQKKSQIPASTSAIAAKAKKLWNTLPSKFNSQLKQEPFLSQSEIGVSVKSNEIALSMGITSPKGMKMELVQQTEARFEPLKYQMEPIMVAFPDLGLSNSENIATLYVGRISNRSRLDRYVPDRNEPSMVNLNPDRKERELTSSSSSKSNREVAGLPLVTSLVIHPELGQKPKIYRDREPEIRPAPLSLPVNTKIDVSFDEVPSDRLRVMDPTQYTLSSLSGEDEGGHAHKLGMQYYWGNSVPKNLRKAARWFHRAANIGDARAQYILGLMALLGQGMRKNYAEAAKWLHKASKQDHAAAQYNLGLLYYAGQGVPKNDRTAYNWFNRAANLGNQPAKNARDTLHSFLMSKKVED